MENERRVMDMFKNKSHSIDEKPCNACVKHHIDISSMSSIASPYPSRKSLSLDGVSEVKSRNIKLSELPINTRGFQTEPFIKVCDGYLSKEHYKYGGP
jgi:hypothetical protein